MSTCAAPSRLCPRLALAAALLMAASLPVAAGEPLFDLDWRLALRGAYAGGGDAARFETLVLPEVAVARKTLRGGYALSAGAEIAVGGPDDARLQALEAALSGDYRLDAVTGLAGRLELALSQDAPDFSGRPDDVAAASLVAAVDAEAAFTRQAGLLELTLRGSVGRTGHGPTTFNDGAIADNGAQDNWRTGAGLRLGYAVTPILVAFVDGDAGYQLYDRPSPAYLVKLDAADYALRTGLAARWPGVLEAEAAAGVNLRRFAEPGFADIVTALYDASLTWHPDETLALGGRFSTTVGAPGPDAGGTARIAYEAAADLRYQMNPWLAVRGSAGWSHASFAGTADSETGVEAGAGLDYLLNAVTTLTADYAYGATSENSGPPEVEHRLTLGATLARPAQAGARD